jgi:hypothetical protein
MHIELCTSDNALLLREHKAALLTHIQEFGGRHLQQLLHFARHVLHGGRFFSSLEEHPPLVVARLPFCFFLFSACVFSRVAMSGDARSLSLSESESAHRSGTPSKPPAMWLVDMVS